MSDENRLPPDTPLRVTLLTGCLHNHLLNLARPAATGCAACGRPWTRHTPDPSDRFPCERCGAFLDSRCYYAYVAPAEEVRRYADPDDDMVGVLFHCLGCRS